MMSAWVGKNTNPVVNTRGTAFTVSAIGALIVKVPSLAASGVASVTATVASVAFSSTASERSFLVFDMTALLPDKTVDSSADAAVALVTS